MKIYSEDSLRSFEFWSGARDRAKMLTDDQLDRVESELEAEYPDGIENTALNDLFWFDFEYICQLAGVVYDSSSDEVYDYDDFEQLDSEDVINRLGSRYESIIDDYMERDEVSTLEELIEDGYADDIAEDIITNAQSDGDIIVNEEDSYSGNWYIIIK